MTVPTVPINPLHQTREQQYASAIYKQIEAIQSHPGRDKYLTTVRSLPVLVRTAGLAQACAFVLTRSDEMQRRVLDDLAAVVLTQSGSPHANGAQLQKLAIGTSLDEYLYLTRQVLSALAWYRRFGDWLLDKQPAMGSPSSAAVSEPEAATTQEEPEQ